MFTKDLPRCFWYHIARKLQETFRSLSKKRNTVISGNAIKTEGENQKRRSENTSGLRLVWNEDLKDMKMDGPKTVLFKKTDKSYVSIKGYKKRILVKISDA